MRIIHQILSHEAETKGTCLKEALEAADRMMKHKGIILVVSDFIAEDYEKALRKIAKRHDVIAISNRRSARI